MIVEYPAGATPLEPEELLMLMPTHITTQGELNEWEQANILRAQSWLENYNGSVLTETFLINLHKKMFDQTWKWAGQFRRSNKNIGVNWIIIPIQLKLLIEDTNFQIQNNSFGIIEIAARFHHRLVAIHLFPNGNGRHARLASDQLLRSLNHPCFTWGKEHLTNPSKTRQKYISALQAADRHDIQPLLDFVNS